MRRRTALIAIVAMTTLGACGGNRDTSTDGAQATPTTAPRVTVKITDPQEGASVEQHVAVHGLVSPTDATVDVNGKAADVQAGRFTATVVLSKGDRQLQATAAAAGASDQTTVAVKRLPSAAEKRAAARKRRVAARRKAAKARRRQARTHDASGPSESDGSFAMPNEVGNNLQEAQDDIQRASGDPLFVSHSRDATGGDRFQILDRDWKVCGQNVPPGQRVSAVGHIVFSVVKDYEDCP